MAQNSLIQVRVDDNLKKLADALFSNLGMDTPTAIRLFLKQSLIRRGLPFPVITGDDFYNEYNIEVLNEAKKGMDSEKIGTHGLTKNKISADLL